MSCTWGTALQEWTGPAWVPHRPQFLPGTCSSMDAPWVAASFKKVFERLQHGYLCCILPWTARGQHASSLFFGWRWISNPAHETSPSLFPHWSQMLHSIFYSSLNMFSQKLHQPSQWAQLCPAVGPLGLPGTVCVQLRAATISYHRGHLCDICVTNALPSKSNTPGCVYREIYTIPGWISVKFPKFSSEPIRT